MPKWEEITKNWISSHPEPSSIPPHLVHIFLLSAPSDVLNTGSPAERLAKLLPIIDAQTANPSLYGIKYRFNALKIRATTYFTLSQMNKARSSLDEMFSLFGLKMGAIHEENIPKDILAADAFAEILHFASAMLVPFGEEPLADQLSSLSFKIRRNLFGRDHNMTLRGICRFVEGFLCVPVFPLSVTFPALLVRSPLGGLETR
jgi:hypothetical protein